MPCSPLIEPPSWIAKARLGSRRRRVRLARARPGGPGSIKKRRVDVAVAGVAPASRPADVGGRRSPASRGSRRESRSTGTTMSSRTACLRAAQPPRARRRPASSTAPARRGRRLKPQGVAKRARRQSPRAASAASRCHFAPVRRRSRRSRRMPDPAGAANGKEPSSRASASASRYEGPPPAARSPITAVHGLASRPRRRVEADDDRLRLRGRDEAQPGGRDDRRAFPRCRSAGAGVSKPCTSLRSGPADRRDSPGGRTTSRPVTQLPVTPYLKACGPPAFVAMLPPSVDCSPAPGSGGKTRPFSRATRRIRAVRHPPPPPRRHNRDRRSGPMRLSSERTMPPTGRAPPASPVPPPRVGVTATPASWGQAQDGRHLHRAAPAAPGPRSCHGRRGPRCRRGWRHAGVGPR